VPKIPGYDQHRDCGQEFLEFRLAHERQLAVQRLALGGQVDFPRIHNVGGNAGSVDRDAEEGRSIALARREELGERMGLGRGRQFSGLTNQPVGGAADGRVDNDDPMAIPY